jgi:cell division protein FtsB
MSALINQARNRVPRIAEAAVERARLTVVPRRTTRAARVPFVTLVSLLLVSGVAGLLLFNTSMQQASFTATAMEARAEVLDAREQSLQMELERLRDPQRVAVQARAIGMVPPNSPAFLRLSDGKVLGNPTPALVEDGLRVAPLPTRKPPNLRPEPVIVELPAEAKGRAKSKSHDRGAADPANGHRAGTKNKSDDHGQQGSRR